MFGSVSFTEILIVLVILMLIFGAGRLSDIGRGLGEGVANFVKGVKSIKETDHEIKDTPSEKSAK